MRVVTSETERYDVTMSDGAIFPLTVYPAQNTHAPQYLFMLPAMGVGGRYYSLLAEQLASLGITVIVSDMRGQGLNRPLAGRKTKYGFIDIVERDVPELVAFIRRELGVKQLWFLGHSLGGQLGLLAEAHGRIGFAGVVLVASGSAWYKGQIGWRQLRHLLCGELFAAISRVCGYWPGDIFRFGGRQSAQLMFDCARQTRTGRYAFPGASADYERDLQAMDQTVLVVDIDGDRLTPPPSVTHLCSKIPNARVTRVPHPRPRGTSLNPHFGWIRHSHDLPPRIAEWMQARTGNRQHEP